MIPPAMKNPGGLPKISAIKVWLHNVTNMFPVVTIPPYFLSSVVHGSFSENSMLNSPRQPRTRGQWSFRELEGHLGQIGGG